MINTGGDMIRITILCMLAVLSLGIATAQDSKPMVRMAKIVVDSAQLEKYRAALKEGIETAVRVEPGVLTLYAVYEKDHPTHVTVLEVYADEQAYKTHLQTPHFKKYKNTTMGMVRSLELVEMEAIGLEAKAKVH
ncbi:MAG: antibiotic biosynthesis monooxygenase [Sphingobacteriales bacterium]|nr:antibiotic biosynthesis monooxygenase [Sphingobacteriales bacterium]